MLEKRTADTVVDIKMYGNNNEPEAGSRKPEVGIIKSESGFTKPEAGSRKPET